ncbi:MAG TPA: secondary thiamine-phosphate synthase enzyme YjbQ [Bacteroidales bacterium]|nr:secondary thiamine-phosphate synthase enzyme YjbQ [Bacteroidales bacterium]
MITQKEITLPSFGRGYHLITSVLQEHLKEKPETGLLHVFIKHTSAGLTINENADPSVREDMESTMRHIVPENPSRYTHTAEGSDDMPAHVKTSLIGMSLTIPVTNGRLNLGTWQGIFLCEFRNHKNRRKLVLTLYS